jgi:signal transduction histidine kinase
MTALTDMQDKVKGFELGAVDYVTKPFYSEEVLARVNTHLTLRNLQKTLQLKNRQLTQLNQEKDEFLGIAAHDLKNPLSSIQGLATLIANDIDNMPRAKKIEYLKLIQVSSERMFDLIKALLDVNAIESGQMQIQLAQITLVPLVEQVVQSYYPRAKAKNITLNLQVMPNIMDQIVAHEGTLRQILDNLVSNAIKYSQHGQFVTIRLHNIEQRIRCAIQDEGPGLSAADQQKLFNKFTRLKPRPTGGESSTGLGLYIVKKLVETMQGKVWCESELNEGATFIVELPLATKESS